MLTSQLSWTAGFVASSWALWKLTLSQTAHFRSTVSIHTLSAIPWGTQYCYRKSRYKYVPFKATLKIYALWVPFDCFGCYEFQKSSMDYSVSGHVAHAEYYRTFHWQSLTLGWEMYIPFQRGILVSHALRQRCDTYFAINPRDQRFTLSSEISVWYNFHTFLNFLLETYQGVFLESH